VKDQSGWMTYPSTVQDEFAVGLVILDRLRSQTCGTRVKLEDVGCHGSTGGGGGGSEGIQKDGTVAY